MSDWLQNYLIVSRQPRRERERKKKFFVLLQSGALWTLIHIILRCFPILFFLSFSLSFFLSFFLSRFLKFFLKVFLSSDVRILQALQSPNYLNLLLMLSFIEVFRFILSILILKVFYVGWFLKIKLFWIKNLKLLQRMFLPLPSDLFTHTTGIKNKLIIITTMSLS